LENIVYVDPEEIKKCKSPIELQMKIDSVKPTLSTKGDINKHVESIHDTYEAYKYHIENSRNFRSIKDKFLGLPFMLKRHQQFPVPVRGTWQFDVYEHIFGEAYDKAQGLPENEEKINKFNYHLFLHPSVIAKFDTNTEEFDMYLRQLNFESKTAKETRAKSREYFCTSILPILNLVDDKETGFDFANYVVNKQKSDDYKGYLHEQYSGQKEEELFREMEEAKLVDKNKPFVERVSFSTIDKSKIGIRSKELEDLLTNPTAIKKMRRALEYKYPFYEPVKEVDRVKMVNNINNSKTAVQGVAGNVLNKLGMGQPKNPGETRVPPPVPPKPKPGQTAPPQDDPPKVKKPGEQGPTTDDGNRIMMRIRQVVDWDYLAVIVKKTKIVKLSYNQIIPCVSWIVVVIVLIYDNFFACFIRKLDSSRIKKIKA
jgi:hypothetical protein